MYVCVSERESARWVGGGGKMVPLSLVFNVGSSVTSLEEMDQRFMSRIFSLSHT